MLKAKEERKKGEGAYEQESVVPNRVPWFLVGSWNRGDLRHHERVVAPPLLPGLISVWEAACYLLVHQPVLVMSGRRTVRKELRRVGRADVFQPSAMQIQTWKRHIHLDDTVTKVRLLW